MKIINIKKKDNKFKDFELFIDKNTKKYKGFSGTVSVYDKKVYVDTRVGKGYGDVIEYLKPLIYRLASKYRFSGNTFEDNKHDIIIHILEGIPKYDPRKNTKLSTFMEMRVNRRLINDIRDTSRISRNATYLNVGVFSVECECGHTFITKMAVDSDIRCECCNKLISGSNKKISINTPEINESSLSKQYENYFDEQALGESYTNNEDKHIVFMHDIKNWLRDEDPRIVKIIELIYFHDYSINSAAEKVGLSGAGANIKLKELAHNKKVKELFGR